MPSVEIHWTEDDPRSIAPEYRPTNPADLGPPVGFSLPRDATGPAVHRFELWDADPEADSRQLTAVYVGETASLSKRFGRYERAARRLDPQLDAIYQGGPQPPGEGSTEARVGAHLLRYALDDPWRLAYVVTIRRGTVDRARPLHLHTKADRVLLESAVLAAAQALHTDYVGGWRGPVRLNVGADDAWRLEGA